MTFSPNYKSFCDFCNIDIMICGKCGNNTCNGGRGEMFTKDPDIMAPCDQCPSAHKEANLMYTKCNGNSI